MAPSVSDLFCFVLLSFYAELEYFLCLFDMDYQYEIMSKQIHYQISRLLSLL